MHHKKFKFLIGFLLVRLMSLPLSVQAQEIRAVDTIAPVSAQEQRSSAKPTSSAVATPVATDENMPTPESWALHGQVTNVTQHHARFASPYSGANSLSGGGRTEETTDISVYIGRSLWEGAELWINPELDQGFGLDNTVGAAGFPSGEAYKLGANTPYWRIPRAFIRQVISLGGSTEAVEGVANQLAGTKAADNITLTIGKFSVIDIFDTNLYAHDPRADFLNWSVISSGAFDYAADSWGYTYGAAAEWTQSWWTIRGGLFQLSKVPNGKVIGFHPEQFMAVAEVEERHQWLGHPGKFKLLGYINRGNMASYSDAMKLAVQTNTVPDVFPVRRVSTRPGLSLNLEQEVTSDLGIFARLSLNDGRKEAYEFTEINQSLSLGLSLKGHRWGRSEDAFGIAAAVNKLSNDAKRFFSAGGIGILIGDGQLNYRPEQVLEAYYSMHIYTGTNLSLGFQRMTNPAYNTDRGPVNIGSIRLHAEF